MALPRPMVGVPLTATGGVAAGPIDSTLPTDATTALPAGVTPLGLVGERSPPPLGVLQALDGLGVVLELGEDRFQSLGCNLVLLCCVVADVLAVVRQGSGDQVWHSSCSSL